MNNNSPDTASRIVETTKQTVNGFTIVVEHPEILGTSWVVRTYRKKFFCTKRVSSDWFLDGVQADRFARQLISELERGAEHIRTRQPGWTLRRPAR